MKRIIVLGGGVGGLSAGWMLSRTGKYEVTVIESAPVTGGACGTFRFDEFLLDYGPHKLYSTIPGIMDEIQNLMGDELLKHEKKNTIFLFNRYLHYPIRMTDLALKMGMKNFIQCGLSASKAIISSGKNDDSQDSYEKYIINYEIPKF